MIYKYIYIYVYHLIDISNAKKWNAIIWLLYKFLNFFLILIKYKLYIYDIIGSTTGLTSETWADYFSGSEDIMFSFVW